MFISARLNSLWENIDGVQDMIVGISGVDLVSGLGWKKTRIDHGTNTLYVYLLTSSLLYKNTAYLGGGEWCIRPYNLLFPPPCPLPPQDRRLCYELVVLWTWKKAL